MSPSASASLPSPFLSPYPTAVPLEPAVNFPLARHGWQSVHPRGSDGSGTATHSKVGRPGSALRPHRSSPWSPTHVHDDVKYAGGHSFALADTTPTRELGRQLNEERWRIRRTGRTGGITTRLFRAGGCKSRTYIPRRRHGHAKTPGGGTVSRNRAAPA